MKRAIFVLILVYVGLIPDISQAANRYVRPGATGGNNGSDWTNAYQNLPSVLVRGDTYYLADGTYGSRTFSDANSGTTPITIRKATASDHGTDIGWLPSYGDGQAVFTGWNIYTDYYVFDGQTRNADWQSGAVDQYGISTGNTRLDNGAGTGGDNLTFQYIDFHGGGRDTGKGDDVIYGLTGNTNITFQYCALHDSDRTIFLTRNNWTNWVVDQSYMARNASSPASHGELASIYSSTNVTFSNNVIEDIEGTAVFAGIGNGASSNWKIFGNTFYHSPNFSSRYPTHTGGLTGIIFIANDATNRNSGNNILFYNNTMVNIVGLYSGVTIQSGTGNEVRNNLWYNSVRTNNSFGGSISHNWYYNTIQDGDTTATKTVCTSACDVFTSLTRKVFSLKAPTASGAALSAPYNVDMDQNVRGADGTWDRGAFEFSASGGGTTIQPPTNLRIGAL